MCVEEVFEGRGRECVRTCVRVCVCVWALTPTFRCLEHSAFADPRTHGERGGADAGATEVEVGAGRGQDVA